MNGASKLPVFPVPVPVSAAWPRLMIIVRRVCQDCCFCCQQFVAKCDNKTLSAAGKAARATSCNPTSTSTSTRILILILIPTFNHNHVITVRVTHGLMLMHFEQIAPTFVGKERVEDRRIGRLEERTAFIHVYRSLRIQFSFLYKPPGIRV